MQQQQQQHANFDLLAVFPEEKSAEAAETKLRKEGFSEEEVFRMAASSAGKGEFREHGPNRDRSSVFLQTTRSRPRPALIILLAIIFGLVIGGLSFGVVEIGFPDIPLLPAILAGALLGIVLGAIIGWTRRGQVRGMIGQDLAKVRPPATPGKKPGNESKSNELTVVAMKLLDPANISRKSKARAILLNGGGKLDRSIGGR